MTTPTTNAVRERHILRVHFHLTTEDPELYDALLDVLTTVTPLVQRLPPLAADLDVTGSLRLFDCDAATLGRLLQVRVMALHGVETSIGAAPNRMLAAMAADATPPGDLTVLPAVPDALARFLRPRPVAALPGIGPATARTLNKHGIHHLGTLADTPLLTLQRLLGTAQGRQLHDRAHGQDPRPVTVRAPAQSLSTTHPYDHDELDPATHRRTLLALTEDLGLRLRTTGQITTTLALTVRYADRTTTTRSRTLTEPTHHSPALADTAHDLYTRLGLQRARVRALTLRAEGLLAAQDATHQLSLDPDDDRTRAAEAAADRVRARFGPTAAVPAALALSDRTTSPRLRADAKKKEQRR
ncbi:DNA polymerase Y family protein (plasmid) [Streptomyces sp. CA-294286]|uniref:DNA polymerase Y family protein n=1 Tax=Streptomyces sp. CA-294286 TaxID=3240070 RepID=UPI003D914B51